MAVGLAIEDDGDATGEVMSTSSPLDDVTSSAPLIDLAGELSVCIGLSSDPCWASAASVAVECQHLPANQTFLTDGTSMATSNPNYIQTTSNLLPRHQPLPSQTIINMSVTKSIETALAKSTHIVEGILLGLKCQSKLDEATANHQWRIVHCLPSLAEHHRGPHSPPPHRHPNDGLNQRGDPGVAAVACTPGTSSARAPSIKVVDEAHPSSTAVTATAPPAIKIEQVVGDIEMGDGNCNNNNVVSKAIAKGKGKERVVIEEVGEDVGQEVTVKTVAKEAKGKGKAKEEEGVVEQTTATEKSKNKGKWRESSKGIKKTRGRSQSTATSKFNVMSAAKVQAWPASTATAGSPKPKASTTAPPASSDEVITNLQSKTLMMVVEAMRRHLMTLPVPLPTLADVDLTALLLRHGPEGPLPENQEGGGYNTPSASSINSPANPLPPLPTIPKSMETPTVLLPPPVVLAPLPVIPQQSAPPLPSPSVQPSSEDIAQSSAPPITILSAPGTPSSGPDTVTMPKADMQAPGPAGAPEALPVTIGAAEAGQPPRAVSPMDELQATPRVTTLEVDTRSTTAMGSAVQEQHAAVPISAA
ncbi:hypothetical protein PAXRUDRAFT_18701 [Paxillus rubicundulus Ve08.2h10]|uniref:Uncharacterized protein n=1 Tax=Paxillus rubicundulus Ve08.2h10 TaxID=930991 RepID=A0A0D0CXA0_9AGAM|nr:hypothetical protein PAXRUDRAFT_18701 [Paxillus rubicundulus Ve08.2h10]